LCGLTLKAFAVFCSGCGEPVAYLAVRSLIYEMRSLTIMS
jgi:hypothetical protein